MILPIAPFDYTNITTSLTIDSTLDPANSNTSVSFSIPTAIDNINEPDIENLLVNGTVTSNNVGRQDLQKTGGIVDIDPFPIIQVEDLTVTEGEPFNFEIKLVKC